MELQTGTDMNRHDRRKRPAPRSVVLKNPLTKEMFPCTIIDEELIEGVPFLVVELNGRVSKLNKSAYTIMGK